MALSVVGRFTIGWLVGFLVTFVLLLTFQPALGATGSSPFIALNSQGRPLVGATITVVDTATSLDVTADLKSNIAGTSDFNAVVPQSGVVQFFGSAGTYQITISGQGVTRTYVDEIPSAATGIEDSDFPSANLPGHLIATSSGTYGAIKHNLTATTDPTTGDDSGDDYAVGSIWVNVTLDKVFFLVDSTVANAVWVEAAAGAVTGASNVGTGADVFKQLSGTTLQFRDLVAGDGISIAQMTNDITITGPTISFGVLGTDLSVSTAGSSITLQVPDASLSARGVITTGAQSFAGNKAFAGVTTFNNTLSAVSNAVFLSTASFNGLVLVNGNIELGDTAADTITVNGTTTFIDPAVTTTFEGTVLLDGPTTVDQDLTVTGDTILGDSVADDLTISGDTIIGRDLTVADDVTFTGMAAVNKAVCIMGTGRLGVCSTVVAADGSCTCV